MKSVIHRPLGQSERRTVAFQVQQIYFSSFLAWLCGEMASVIELKDDRLVNPLSTLICWGKHVVSAHIQVHHWCGLSIMRVSFWKTTPFNSRGKQAELSIVLFVIDGYRFNRRSHFKLYRSEWLFGSSGSLLSGCVIVHDAQLLILPCEKCITVTTTRRERTVIM